MLPQLVLTAGLGFPALVHGEIGRFVHPNLDVHATAAAPLLQPAVGLGLRGSFGPHDVEDAPHDAFTAALDLTVNPANPVLYSGGERLGILVWPMVGYGRVATSGFVVRAEVGALVGLERGTSAVEVTGGPAARVAIGYAWR